MNPRISGNWYSPAIFCRMLNPEFYRLLSLIDGLTGPTAIENQE